MPERTILLVEDNPDDEELTLSALRRNGLANDVIVARDGVEALDYLFGTGKFAAPKREHLPQVVLLDLKLPKVGGLEVIKRLRADPELRTLPVVVLTSSGEDEDILRSYELGANSYVRKPVEFQLFSEAVRQLGLYWLLINEAPRRGIHPG